MKLIEYKKSNKLRWKNIAKGLGISPAHLSMIVRGKRKMPPNIARKVEDYTNGSVSIYEALGQDAPARPGISSRLKAIAGTLMFIADHSPDMQDAGADIEEILDELYAVRELTKRRH